MNQFYCRCKWRVIVLLLMGCFSLALFGQQKVVTGQVLDEKAEPIIGVTVQIKGTTGGSITDVDGKFKIAVNDVGKATLVFSFIGYASEEVALKGRTFVKMILKEAYNELEEVTVVAYGTQKKETLTGAISSVKTDALLRSPNTSVANSLAGQITGLSTVTTSGQPGNEDPTIFIRGAGSLTDAASAPLILVDGVERSFTQMDPNEIESVTVLKDASATAVFGVRGANGVILVTTRRGEEGKARIQLTSSVGITQPTNNLEMADSYTYATMMNEMNRNDNTAETFDFYTLERFRLHDEPIMYPDTDWRKYAMRKASVQTQRNVNISGGTKDVRYFISLGFLYQDGLLKQFKSQGYNNNYKYTRYNYRSNLDINLTKTTELKLGLGGLVGVRQEPKDRLDEWGEDLFKKLDESLPFSSPGLVDGNLLELPVARFPGFTSLNNGFSSYYGMGYIGRTTNTMNMDLSLMQKLDFITKGLSVEVKGAYNTTYTSAKKRLGSVEVYQPYYASELDGSNLKPGDSAFDKTITYLVKSGTANVRPQYQEDNSSRSRDWYFETSLRYSRKFGDHNIGGLVLYNQTKKYYPSVWTEVPRGYIGLVGRATYDYKSRYMAEFNIGYNGSENFAPDKRFGTFPAFSLGYILSEEDFMKKQKVVDYLKLRASVGLVGNDNMNNSRFLYLKDGYLVDQWGQSQDDGKESTGFKDWLYGYNFGINTENSIKGAIESRLGNRNVTWETALKQNYGIDINFLRNRLRISADLFFEKRKDILIQRNTIPVFYALSQSLMPAVNYGKVNNKGYEVEVKWNDKFKNGDYWITGNMSYSKNKIIEMDEVTPNEPYMQQTGKPTATVFGYVFDRFYREDDFNADGTLKAGLPDPKIPVYPGDCKYVDLNGDNIIDTNDVKDIGYPTRPAYTFGLNYGINYKGWSLTMNWAGAAQRSLMLEQQYRNYFNGKKGGLMMFHVNERWTPETESTATLPRFSERSASNNTQTSSVWIRNGNYLRLKTLQFGYTFTDRELLKKIGISQLTLTLSGYNLLTFTDFDILDPESRPGWGSTYPVSRIYNLGLNITF